MAAQVLLAEQPKSLMGSRDCNRAGPLIGLLSCLLLSDLQAQAASGYRGSRHDV